MSYKYAHYWLPLQRSRIVSLIVFIVNNNNNNNNSNLLSDTKSGWQPLCSRFERKNNEIKGSYIKVARRSRVSTEDLMDEMLGHWGTVLHTKLQILTGILVSELHFP